MKLKKTWNKILSLALVLALLLSCAAFAEESVQEENSGLLETFMAYDTIPSLFEAAEDALREGIDPAAVLDALYEAADQKDMYPYFTYALENYVSMGGKGYNALMDVLSSEESTRHELNYDWSSDRSYISSISFDAYSTRQASEAFKSMVNDSGAQYCAPACLLKEKDFKTLYNTDFSKFVPSRPRAGYMCIVVKKDAHSWPNKTWSDSDEDDDFLEQFSAVISAVCDSCGDSAPVITGNPNLASDFLIYDVSFSANRNYIINNVTRVRGYNTVFSVTLKDASTKKDLASYKETVKIKLNAGMYFKWDNGIMKVTDTPDFSNNSSMKSFGKAIASEVRKQENLASATRPLTERNAKAVLAGILETQAKDADAWEYAIYTGGAENISLNGSEVSFSLRSFDPKLKDLGSYRKAKSTSGWIAGAAKNIGAHDLNLTLKISDGKPTAQSLAQIKNAVRKAAGTAKKAYSSSDMVTALKDYLFPAPLEGKVSKYTQLPEPSDSFKELFSDRFRENEYLTAELFSIICYGQKNLTVDTRNGPHNLGLTLTGIADPDKTVASAADTVVENMAALPVGERTALEDPEHALLETIAKTAFSAKEKHTMSIDADELGISSMPDSYMNYLARYDIRSVLESMTGKIEVLPETAAVKMPGSKLLSGGKSGQPLTVKLPAGGKPTYIQVRNEDSRAVVATLFIHPGKSVSLKVPVGEYYLVYCSGTVWHGEKYFFNEPDAISVSESFEMKHNHTMSITLELVSDGNMGVHSGSMDDLE
ncbi:MAG: hypothetical protein K6F61_11705 [Clostridiales bacterium]|nr:hypothetical protein [Clostridiales bacterium]